MIIDAPDAEDHALIKVEVEEYLVSTKKILVADVDEMERANRILDTKITEI
jgi:hypothetical protein